MWTTVWARSVLTGLACASLLTGCGKDAGDTDDTNDTGDPAGDLGPSDATQAWSVDAGAAHVALVPGLRQGGGAAVVVGVPDTAGGGGVLVLDPASAAVGAPTLAGEAAGHELGAALASGDLDGDGTPDLVVGAPGAASSFETDSGSTREVEQGGLVEALLGPVTGADVDGLSGGEEASSYAGSSLAIGDWGGDGRARVAVGVPNHASTGASGGEGLVVILPGAPREWEPIANYGIRLDGAPAGFEAGTTIGAPGDLDGDGIDDLVVGALGDTRQGVVYVLFGPVTADVALPDADAILGGRASAGGALRLGTVGDLDGDGRADLVVGAPGENPGALYVLSAAPAGAVALDAAAASRVEAPDAQGAFGVAFAAGDFDGDGQADLAVGAELDPYGAGQAGAVHLYDGPIAGGPSPSRTIRGDQDAGHFGLSLAAGDVEGDGVDDLLVAGTSGTVWLFAAP